MRPARARAGFTLLEVMIALSILVMSLFILVEIQTSSAVMTAESDRILVATQLALDKMAEVRFLVENEGFSESDVYKEGDFESFGDDALDLEFKELADYHFEYLVTEIDLGLGGDLSSVMSNLQGSVGGGADGASTGAPPLDIGGLPVSEEMITDMLNPFIRQARVRVWWGEDVEEAEEQGNEVVITTFLIQPNANMLNAAGLGGVAAMAGGGQQGGQAGNPAGNFGQRPPGGPPGGPPRGRVQAQGCAWCFGGAGFGGFGVQPGGAQGGFGAGGASSPTAPTRSVEGRPVGAGGRRGGGAGPGGGAGSGGGGGGRR